MDALANAENQALASLRAPAQEEVSAKVLAELADILENHAERFEDFEVARALRDGAAALNLEVVRDARG